MKIKVLCENTALNDSFQSEHGLSLYIETDNHNILFDFGQTDLFYTNALKMGVNLADVDIAFLSHGHYDHSGGMDKFLEVNKKAKIYLNKDAFGLHYNGTDKYIGINQNLKSSNRLIYIDNKQIIDNELTLYTFNELIASQKFPNHSSGLNIRTNNDFIQDKFLHEQYLMIKENDKKILISGCSHKGILNVTEWSKADIIIGGFHLSKLCTDNENRDELELISEVLLKSNCMFYTCHCTGFEQYKFMKNILNEKLHYLSTGEIVMI